MWKSIFYMFLILIFLYGCGGGGTTTPSASFQIISTVNGIKSYGSPFITITIKNVGDATGDFVRCNAQARNDANTIIDTGLAVFAGWGNIKPGESAQDEAIFFSLSSHSDYASVTYDCSWNTT